jgi:hypothetical protein
MLQASKEDGLEINTEKTQYLSVSRHQNAGKYHTLLVANKLFENVAKFKYFGRTFSIKITFTKKLREAQIHGTLGFFLFRLLYLSLL